MAFQGRWSYPLSAVRRFLAPIVFLGAAVAVAADAPATGARLRFESVEQNLGDVVRGQDVVATFTYKNLGDAPLRILSAKPG